MCLLSRVFTLALALWVMAPLVIIPWSQDPGLLHKAAQELEHRHVLQQMTFYVDAGELNSGLHGCAADTLPTKQLSCPLVGSLRFFFDIVLARKQPQSVWTDRYDSVPFEQEAAWA